MYVSFFRNAAITLICSDQVPHLFHALCTSWFMYNVIMDLRVSLTYIFIMCVAVFTVTATKESVDNAEVAVLAKRLYDEIKKRLHDYGDKVDGLQDVDMSKFSLQNETIIKTTSSIKRGAKFLNNSVVESREECAKLCFTNVQCNIAVFHNKKSFSCYLFNCGALSVCEFSSHPDYLTMGLPLRKTGLGQQKKHESDLANLPASITSDSTTTTTTTTATASVSTSSPTTTTTSTTTTTTTQTEPKIGKVQVALFEKCGPMLGECADRYTECLTGFCVCKEGYHPQDGACRKECDRFEFECANVGRPLVYPQCIAVYDKCDGIAQCLDGSDELNCPAVPKDGDKLMDEHKNGGEAPIKTKILPLPVGDKSTVPPVKAITVEPAKMVSDSADKAQLPGLGKNDTSSTSSNKKIMHSKNITDNNVQPEPHKTSGSLGSEVVENREEVVIINKEVVGSAIVHHEAKSDRGAVVALGLGLAVTAILLLFVGCRLRNMKQKLRRGRPMNSNEADYLINGMYL